MADEPKVRQIEALPREVEDLTPAEVPQVRGGRSFADIQPSEIVVTKAEDVSR